MGVPSLNIQRCLKMLLLGWKRKHCKEICGLYGQTLSIHPTMDDGEKMCGEPPKKHMQTIRELPKKDSIQPTDGRPPKKLDAHQQLRLFFSLFLLCWGLKSHQVMWWRKSPAQQLSQACLSQGRQVTGWIRDRGWQSWYYIAVCFSCCLLTRQRYLELDYIHNAGPQQHLIVYRFFWLLTVFIKSSGTTIKKKKVNKTVCKLLKNLQSWGLAAKVSIHFFI